MFEVIVEGIVVGVVVVIVGTLVAFLYRVMADRYLKKNRLPEVCKSWNKYHAMEISLFFTGFLSHVLFDITGFNKWYCKTGYACKKR